MTQDKDFKDKVRARMASRGESYTAARANLVGKPEASSVDDARFEIPDWPRTGFIANWRDRWGPPDMERYVAVNRDAVTVQLGSGTDFSFPRDAVVGARVCHGLREVFNGVGRGKNVKVLYGGGGTVVAIKLVRAVEIQVAGEPDAMTELRIGVDHAERLASLLNVPA